MGTVPCYNHQENMSVKCLPLKPHFYIAKILKIENFIGKKKWYFSYFCSKTWIVGTR